MRLSVVRFFNSKALDSVMARFRSEAPVYLNHNKDIVYKKLVNLNNWYTRLIGLDEVKLYQDRVASLQEKLLAAQEQRRDIGRHLAEIRKKSNQLQDEIHKVKRQEDLERFLNLMKEETEVLKLENEASRAFQGCDQTERELFTAFTNAVRDSHEKQRAQLEYTKYFGIILSIAGSFLAFCYSTLRKNDLKHFIDEKLSKEATVEPVKDTVSTDEDVNTTEILKLVNMINSKQQQFETSMLLHQQSETKRQLVYYVSAGVFLFLALKIFSPSN